MAADFVGQSMFPAHTCLRIPFGHREKNFLVQWNVLPYV
jgi:hypothetical protein